MDGALRAPGLMADIVQVLVALINGNGQKDNNQKKRPLDEIYSNLNLQTGQLGLEQRGRSGSLHQQQRQQNESYQLAPEVSTTDIDFLQLTLPFVRLDWVIWTCRMTTQCQPLLGRLSRCTLMRWTLKVKTLGSQCRY